MDALQTQFLMWYLTAFNVSLVTYQWLREMSFFMDINSHYSQIQLALFSKALPYSTGSSFIFLFKKRGSHFSSFFLLFQPSYSVLETREIIRSGNGVELQINQSCLVSSYCNTQRVMSLGIDERHICMYNPQALLGTHSAAILWLPSTLIDTISSLLPPAASSALWNKGTYSWNSSLTRRGGFRSCKLLRSWVQVGKKKLTFKISISPKFSSICWDNFDLTHFFSTQGTQELVRVHIPQEVINALLALSREWMLAHPTWANQEQRTTHMKPPDMLLDKSSLQKNYPIQMKDGRKKAKCKPSFSKITCNLKLCQKLKLNGTACEKKIHLTNNCNFPLTWWNFLSLQLRKDLLKKNLSSFHKSLIHFCWWVL